jgi:hypothetical protein
MDERNSAQRDQDEDRDDERGPANTGRPGDQSQNERSRSKK